MSFWRRAKPNLLIALIVLFFVTLGVFSVIFFTITSNVTDLGLVEKIVIASIGLVSQVLTLLALVMGKLLDPDDNEQMIAGFHGSNNGGSNSGGSASPSIVINCNEVKVDKKN